MNLSNSTSYKVVVGLSGGVDSSVSAYLLLKQGYQVEGLFMKNWDEDDGTEYCTAKQDLADAQAVCDRLGIKLHTANFASEYWNQVFSYCLAEYKAGRTPNPDVLCNREIKFKTFLEYAKMLGADFIATGHYACRRLREGRYQLLKGQDAKKDQSYFLHAISSEKIAQTLFPLGELAKPQVRQIAQELELVTAEKKDSTGICFIGERKFRDFLQRYLPAKPGFIETDQGDVIGEHQGLMYYTIGQRQGLGIGGTPNHPELPWFVAGKDLERNRLIVVQGHDHPMLHSSTLSVRSIHWVTGKSPKLPVSLNAKIRYRQEDQPCLLSTTQEGYHVAFQQPQRAITPGQSVVFYEGDQCLGGGIIETI